MAGVARVTRTALCWAVGGLSPAWYFTRCSVASLLDRSVRPVTHFQYGARDWATLVLGLGGVEITVTNPERVKRLQGTGPYIIIANHQSLQDVPLLLHTLRLPFAYMAKASLFHIPIFGWYLRFARYVPVRRDDARAAFKSVEATIQCVKDGLSVLVFPEGTRSIDGKLQPFKGGLVRLARGTGCPILPVGIRGTHEVMPPGSFFFHDHPVTVTVGEPQVYDAAALDDRAFRDQWLQGMHDQVAALIEEGAR